MITFNLFSIPALLACLIFQTYTVTAALQSPACSVNCTLEILKSANCPVVDANSVRNCLCSNDTLQYELTLCVFAACNQTEQFVASEILQTEICVGVPHESRKWEILRVEYILAAFAFPMIALRMISRIVIARKVWWDDWMIIFCAIFMVANTTIPIYTAYIGLGVHIWNVSTVYVTRLNLLYFIASLFYAFIQNGAKFSILLLYLRIFPTANFRRLVKIALVWQACHTITFTTCIIFQCIPVQSSWDLTIPRKCINLNAVAKAGAFASILEDFVIMFLPISELSGLNLGLRKRFALCFMFALGSFACITSILRLRYLWHYKLSLDGTWTYVDIVIWSDIETYVAVICSCLMCIRPLISKIFPSSFGSSKNNSRESRSVSRKPSAWSKKIGSTFKGSKLSNSESINSKTTKSANERQITSESTREINIQVDNESERNFHDIELEERGESRSLERTESGSLSPLRDTVLHEEPSKVCSECHKSLDVKS